MSSPLRYPPPLEPSTPGGVNRLPLLVLVAVNLLPVVGVLLGQLSVGDVLLVYWSENVVVGALTLARILTARGAEEETDKATIWVGHEGNRQKLAELAPGAARVLLALFFCFHYGLFTFVHGVFTVVLVAMSGGLDDLSTAAIVGGFVALTVSHLVSFRLTWFRDDERSEVSPSRAMMMPYPRMLVLHATVLVSFFALGVTTGGGAFSGWEEPGTAAAAVPVVVLAGFKTLVDAWMHVKQHRAVQPPTR